MDFTIRYSTYHELKVSALHLHHELNSYPQRSAVFVLTYSLCCPYL